MKKKWHLAIIFKTYPINGRRRKITQPNKEVCECLNISIKILEEIEKGLKEEDITKLYEKESEFCDELSSKLGEEKFGLQMMGCENFGKLMNLLMNQSD